MSRYKSKHTGSEIDAAIDRAKTGGEIDITLQKKMDAVTQAEHELSFADGWHMTWAGAGFSKSQDGQVTLRLNAYRDTPVSPSEGWVTVATLPAGFRPSYFCANCMGRCGTDGSGVGVQVEYTGEIKANFIVERDNVSATFTFVARN